MQATMKGMTLQPAQSFDHFFIIDVTIFFYVKVQLLGLGRWNSFIATSSLVPPWAGGLCYVGEDLLLVRLPSSVR